MAALGVMVLLQLGAGLSAQAQSRATAALFQEDGAAQAAARTSPLQAMLYRARPLSLNLTALRVELATAPLESEPGAAPLVLALPLPDGSTGRFAVYEAPVMAPALAARYPAIRTYAGRGLDDVTATARLDVMPGGFHAQILAAGSGPVYLDPVSPTDPDHYLSFRLADARPRPNPTTCAGTGPEAAASSAPLARSGTSSTANSQNRQMPVGSQLRTYRLAVATTDEYTAVYGGRAAALAGVVRTVNRVVGVYERELAVRLELVPNEDALIAANSSTSPDPFSNNNNYTTAFAQNQTFINQVVGSNYYDLGHVFGTLSSSYASIAVLCSSTKAYGASGFPIPTGDTFDIRTVAHEMGHQLGAYHTFNSSTIGNCAGGNRQANGAYEPGSGSTLLSYAGLCGADNIAGAPDAYFHTSSYQFIQDVLTAYNCATLTATGNTPPSVSAPASGKTLPIGTPFKLTATGSDADNDVLTYCWEQMNLGTSDSPASAQVAGQTPPLFRSWPGSSSATRYFPQLPTILANTTDANERLPTVTRPLTFVCTARDAHNGPLGVVGGVAQSTDLTLSATAAAGPFRVTAPNTALTWASGSTQPVTWNVAGTDANGVNCATVNIRLSTDGGYTYPIVLLAGTPNDGSQPVTVPSVATTTARLMVEAADNYFFDLSNSNFIITASPVAPVLSSLSPGSGTIGSSVTVTGSNLVGLGSVTFNGVSAVFSGVTATGFTVAVPAGASSGPVVATTANGSSNALLFTVMPAINSFSPASGMAGSQVTIVGSHLAGATAVSFNGMAATAFSSNADGTQLTATVPTGASTGLLTVSTPDGNASSATAFTVLPTPCIAPSGLSFRQITSTGAVLLFGSNAATQSYTVTTAPATTTQTVAAGYVVFSGLTASTTYSVSIVSNCAGGQASAPASITFTTAPATLNNECATAVTLAPAAPGAAGSPTGGTVAGATQSQAGIICAGSVASTARDVWYRFVATSPTHTVNLVSPFNGVIELFSGACGSLVSRTCNVGPTLTAVDLTPGATYWVRYFALDPNTTTPTFTVSVTTPATTCEAPSNLAISGIGNTSARLDFTASPTAGAYTISTVPASGNNNITIPNTAYILQGLSHSTTYTVNVTSNCSGGASATASTSFTTTTPPPCTPPNDLRIVNLTTTQATIAFTPNPYYNYFVVTTVPASTSLYTTDNPITVFNLTPGTQYTATLNMQCGAAGTAPVSITFTTLPPPCTAATNLAVSSITQNSASLSFSPSSLATSYVVTTTPATTTQTVTASPVVLSGLQPNVAYTVRISSTCASGAASATAAFTTPAPDLVVSTQASIPTGTYNNVTVTSTGVATLSSGVVVRGTLLVQAGGALLDACHIVSGTGAFVLAAGATLAICHAQGISASGATGSIQLTGGRVFSEDASYLYNGTAAQVTGSGLPGQVFSLGADGAQALSLSQNVSISRELVLNDNFLQLNNSNLTLLSNAAGTAYMVNAGTGQLVLTGTGRATMQRYVQPSIAYTGPGYRHYSSPVAQATVAGLTLPGQFTPLVNPAYNALPTPSLPAAQFPTVFGYDQARLTTTYPGFEAGWYSPQALTDALQPAHGYTVNLRPADTLSLSGLFNTGFIGTGTLRRGTSPDAGWQLLGNPYPAPLDWHRVETTPGGLPTGLNGAIYVFEPSSQYGGFYRSFANNVGTLGFDGVVPAMQGFFVRVTRDIPGGFNFQDAFRVTTYRNPTFHRLASAAADVAGRPLLRLQLSSPAHPETSLDETVIYLENGATITGTDARFDAVKVANPGPVVGLASQMSGAGNEPLAINCLPPMGAASPATPVPLRLTLPAAGVYQLQATALTDFDPAVPVLLLDHALNTTTDLRQQPAYAFQATPAGALNGRFEVLLGRPGTATATAAAASSQFSLWPNPVQHGAALRLTLDEPAVAATATLCNVLGQAVMQRNFSGQTAELATTGLAPGTYLLSVRASGRAAVTRRVVLE